MYRIQKVNSHYTIENDENGYWEVIYQTLTLVGAYHKLHQILRGKDNRVIATFDENGRINK